MYQKFWALDSKASSNEIAEEVAVSFSVLFLEKLVPWILRGLFPKSHKKEAGMEISDES